MDPNSCGVVNILSPMGPWCQSEYSASFSFTFILAVLLMRQIGPNPEEHQRLGMLGTLERQNVRVSWHSSCLYDDLLIPSPML